MNAPSTNTALVALEQQLAPLAPRFEAALAGMMPVERLIRTVMVSVERLPALLNCDRQSIFMAAMSAACLGLEVDGVTGQAFLIPFGNRAQLVIGYKGYNTLAARSGITITGAVVREGDAFDYEKGSAAYVRHRPLLEGAEHRRIVGAWACASHMERPPVIEVMGIDELIAVKEKSPGARKKDSPWNDPKVGFPAMCEKTAKRRLARSLPMSIIQQAARLDGAADEEARAAWITPERGLEIDGQAEAATPYEQSPTPAAARLLGVKDSTAPARPFAEWAQNVELVLAEDENPAALRAWWEGQAEERRSYDEEHHDAVVTLHNRVSRRVRELTERKEPATT